jgi:hypothetical protein
MTSTPSRDRIDGIATAGSGKKSEQQIINKLQFIKESVIIYSKIIQFRKL